MDSVFSRYSNALVSLAIEEKKPLEYKMAINLLNDYFENNSDVFSYLKSYFVSDEKNYEIIDCLCKDIDIKNINSFLKLLIKKHRLIHFKKIAKEFNKSINTVLGIAEGIIYSTTMMDKKEIERIETAIAKKIGQKVELTNKIDESLIGGFKVAINDFVFDYSLKNKLELLKNNLNERRSAKWK